MGVIDDLAGERYLLLSTFRRSGVPVATAVWAARDGDSLVVVTGAESGKVKRIRANGRATLQPCSMRGRPRPGSTPAPVQAALVRDAAEVERALGALDRKYGWQYRLMVRMSREPADGSGRAIVRLTA